MKISSSKLIQHVRTYGILITLIDSIKYIIRIVSKIYFSNRVRKKAVSTGPNLSVNHQSNINESTYLGKNVNFNGMSIQGSGTVRIGDNFHSGSDCLIMTENHNYDNGEAIPYDDTYIYKDITIGDNVWLGSRVTILPGVTIEEGAIIQAGSTVTSDIPKGAIAGGHPAEVFDNRDMDHYEQHKLEGNYH